MRLFKKTHYPGSGKHQHTHILPPNFLRQKADTHLGLQQRGCQDVGAAAGELAAEVPAGDAPLARIASPAHNIRVPLRLLRYELRDVLGLQKPTQQRRSDRNFAQASNIFMHLFEQ